MTGGRPESSATTPPRVDARSPWPGLFSFAEADSKFFFGREDETEELLELVRNHRLTVLYAASGLGKSSLLRAGLFPRLREHDYLPVLLRLNYEPRSPLPASQLQGELARVIEESGTHAPAVSSTESVWEYLHRHDVELWSPRQRLLTPVFVFDQFEELFSRTARDTPGDVLRRSVVESIADLSEGRIPRDLKSALEGDPSSAARYSFREHRYRLLLAMREDYLPDLDELTSAILSLGRSRMRLTHLRGTRAIAAVSAAGRAAQIVPAGMAKEIVDFVSGSTASAQDPHAKTRDLPIEPALLSVVCFQLNEKRIRDGRPELSRDDLKEGGKILEQFYADAVADSPEPLPRFLEDHLITAEGIREMSTYDRLLREAGGISEQDVDHLIERRILRVEYRQGRRLVELSHDLVAREVRKSRERRRQFDRSAEPTSEMRQLAALLEGLRALGSARVLDEVLALVLDSAIEVTGVERGLILLADRRGELEVKVARARGKVMLPGTRFAFSEKIANETYRTDRPQYFRDLLDPEGTSTDEWYWRFGDDIALGIRLVVCIPLRGVTYVDSDRQRPLELQSLGVLYLDSREKGFFFAEGAKNALDTLATESATAIQNAKLYRDTLENVRFEQELRIAADIQALLLPPGRDRGVFYDAVARSVPARAIGGDFFDFAQRADGSFGLAIGDVAGKGPAAALLAAKIQGVLDVSSDQGTPSDIIGTLNRGLMRRAIAARFATVVYATLTPSGLLRYCNAGSNHPFVVSGESVVRLDAQGVPIGIFAELPREEATVQLASGDIFLAFTDGVSEALNEDGEEFGEERVVEAVRSADRQDPERVLDSIMEKLRIFTSGAPQADDLTLVVVRYESAGRGNSREQEVRLK